MKNNFEALLDFTKSYTEDDIEKHTPSKADWIVEGYAATSDLDAQNHIINQDALNMGAECLKKYDTVLFNHDMDRPIGVIKHVESQPGKLFVKVAISKSEPKIWQQIQDNTLSKFSIRGRITDSEVTRDQLTEKQILVIKGMDLHETSIVSIPANIQARSMNHYIEKALFPVQDEMVDEDVIVKINTKSLTKSIIASIKSNITEFLNLEKKEEVKTEPITIELTDEVKKGGQEKMEVKKEDEVKTDEIKKSDEIKTEDVKKSDEVTLNVGALREVITQFQGLAKTITDQSATVQALVDSAKKDSELITKTKEEITKVFSDLNELVKEIPLRKGQTAEKEDVEVRKDKTEEEDFTKTDEYKKLTPMDQLHKLFSVGLAESNK